MAELGLAVEVCAPPASSEPAPVKGETARDYAVRAAVAKVLALASGLAGTGLASGFSGSTSSSVPPPSSPYRQTSPSLSPVILGADTVVVLDGEILGKPSDAAEALSFLTRLAGRTHEVITGCAVWADAALTTFAAHTRVTMWDCPPALLARYAASGEPLDKAGAYAIQGAGAFLVESIEGSWSNVVGLPVAELIQVLLEKNAVVPLPD